MRIPLSCMKCFQVDGHPDDMLYQAELQDNGLYWMKCRAGHETVTCLQEQKFELLFDLAANAIVDGYYREAVSSFNSSLERFWEFYVHVICEKAQISEESFTATWKKVAAQSERQLGAFAFLYLVENATPPQLLPDAMTKFRNDVIHKGKIPTRQEAVTYGQEILNLIVPVLKALKAEYSELIGKIVGQHISNTQQQIAGTPHTSFMSIPTNISLSRAIGERQPTLQDTLAELEHKRRRSKW